MRRALVYLAIAGLLVGYAASGCSPGGKKGAPKGPESKAETVKVRLYFGDKNAEFLVAEDRVMEAGSSPVPELVVRGLIEGPSSPELSATIPPGSRLLDLQVKDGVAYVNFSEEFQKRHWGGSTGEIMTVYSIVNSLTELPGIDKVQLLVEGQPLDTLAGHLITKDPIPRAPDLIVGN